MSNVRVAVRVRPFSKKEIDHNAKSVVDVREDCVTVTNLKVDPGGYGDSRERRKKFTFDHCYDSTDPKTHNYASQEQVFQDLGTDVLASALEGYNACLFAYGQTGSGKTHTMMGYQDELGLIPRICEGLFSRVDDFPEEELTFKVEVSYLEIYNERVRDLLQQSELSSSEGKYTLKVREHPKDGPYVQDLSKHLVKDYEEIKTILHRGNENRTTAATYMHDHSSRSHAIFSVVFSQAKFENDLPSETVSKINLVDLAGSERADPTFSSDYKGRLKEGANINKSLVTLGGVIKTLAERSLLTLSTDNLGSMQNVHSEGRDSPSPPVSSRRQRPFYVPYRDSVLTWLLKDSLGGNSKTIMIATITPASNYYNETISTLRYAQRAKSIINRPHVNEDPNVKIIRELRREIDRLRSMLATAHMAGSLMSLQDSGSLLEARLEENEAMANELTQTWIDKWEETHHVMKESDLSIRGLGRRSSSHGVIIDSQLPHLIGMDDDILSTGVLIYHLKEGSTRIGTENHRREPDIVLRGPAIKKDHCVIKNKKAQVTLHPKAGASCSINGIDIKEPTSLTQGDVILFGKTHIFRFNNPAQAAILREHRKSLQDSSLEIPESLSSSPSLSDSYSSSTSPFRIFNPNVELDKKFPTEVERIEKARCELEKIREERMHAEEKEEALWEEHSLKRAQVDAEKQKLAEHISQLQAEKHRAEEAIEESKRRLREEELKYQENLGHELVKLESLRARQRRDFGSQTEGAKANSVDTAIQPDDEEDGDEELEEPPISGAVGAEIHQRRMSLEGRVKQLAEQEFLHVLSHKETVEQLVREEEDLEDEFEAAQEEIVQVRVRIKELESSLREAGAEHVAAMEAERQQVAELQRQEEQLELYIQHKQDLMMVEADTPRPLRGACSEEMLSNSPRPDEDLLSKTRSLNTLSAEEDMMGMSEFSSNVSLGSMESANSMETGSQDSVSGSTSSAGGKSRSRSSSMSTESKKVNSKAKAVTDRLYKPRKPRADLEGNYLKKKERELPPTAPRSYRSRSPLVSPSKRPAKDRNTKVAPKGRTGALAHKPAAPARASRSPAGSQEGPGSPDGKPPRAAPLRPRSRIRQLASSSSLASVPEAVGEEGENVDSTTHSVPNIPSIDTSSVVRRKKKSRGLAQEDEFRRHSDPYGEELASALEEYTNTIEKSFRREGCSFTDTLSQDDLVWKGAHGSPAGEGADGFPEITVTDLSDSVTTESTVRAAGCDSGDQDLSTEETEDHGDHPGFSGDELTPRVDAEVGTSGDDLTPRVSLATGWTQTASLSDPDDVPRSESSISKEFQDADTITGHMSVSISCQTEMEFQTDAAAASNAAADADSEMTTEKRDKACETAGDGDSEHEFSVDSLEDEDGTPEKFQQVTYEDQSCQTGIELVMPNSGGAKAPSKRTGGEDECSQLSDDSLAGAHAELQVLQQVLDHINSAGPGANGRKGKRHRQSNRQARGSGSDNGDQLSDDSLNTGSRSRSSSRPGSASRRRKKPASRHAEVAAKRLREGLSSEEYATSDDSLYSEDSLTQEGRQRSASKDEPSRNAEQIAAISSSVQELTAALEASLDGTSVDAPDGGTSGEAPSSGVDQSSMSSSQASQTAGSVTQANGGRVVMGVSPVSIWSSEDMHQSTPVDWNTAHCGVQTVADRSVVSLSSRRPWNLSVSPVDMWASPASLEANKLSDSDSELGNTTDSGIDVKRFRAGDGRAELGRGGEQMTVEGYQQMAHSSPSGRDRSLSPSSPRMRAEEVHTYPSGSSSASSQRKGPVKYEVTINEDTTKILYNVEKTEYKTFALKDRSPETQSNHSSSAIPDEIRITTTETKMIHTDDRCENIHRENILMQSSDSSAGDGERIVSQKMFRARRVFEHDMETSGEDISRESSVERQFRDEDFSSYVVSSLQPSALEGPDSVDGGAAAVANENVSGGILTASAPSHSVVSETRFSSMSDHDSGLDTMRMSVTPNASLPFQSGVDGSRPDSEKLEASSALGSTHSAGTSTSRPSRSSPTWQFPELVSNRIRKTHQGQVPQDYTVALALNNSLNLSGSYDATKRSRSQEGRQFGTSVDPSRFQMSAGSLQRSASEGRSPLASSSPKVSTASEKSALHGKPSARTASSLQKSDSLAEDSQLLTQVSDNISESRHQVLSDSHSLSRMPGNVADSTLLERREGSLSSSLEQLQYLVQETFPLDDEMDSVQAGHDTLSDKEKLLMAGSRSAAQGSDRVPELLDANVRNILSHHHPPTPHSFAYSRWIAEHESQPSFTVAGARTHMTDPAALDLASRSSVAQMATMTVSSGAARATADSLEANSPGTTRARISSVEHPLHSLAGSSTVPSGVSSAAAQSSLVRDGVIPGTTRLGPSTVLHHAPTDPSARLVYGVKGTVIEHSVDYVDEGSSLLARNVDGGGIHGSLQTGSSLRSPEVSRSQSRGAPRSQPVEENRQTVSEYTIDYFHEGSSLPGSDSHNDGILDFRPGGSSLSSSAVPLASEQGPPSAQLVYGGRETVIEHTIHFMDEGSTLSDMNKHSDETSMLLPGRSSQPVPGQDSGSVQRAPSSQLTGDDRETVTEYTITFADGVSSFVSDVTDGRKPIGSQQKGSLDRSADLDPRKAVSSGQPAAEIQAEGSASAVPGTDGNRSESAQPSKDKNASLHLPPSVAPPGGETVKAASSLSNQEMAPPGQVASAASRSKAMSSQPNQDKDSPSSQGEQGKGHTRDGDLDRSTSRGRQAAQPQSASPGLSQGRGAAAAGDQTSRPCPRPDAASLSIASPPGLQSGPVVLLSQTTSPHGSVSAVEVKKGAPQPTPDFMTLEEGATVVMPPTSLARTPLGRSPRQSQSSSGHSTPRRSSSEKGSTDEEETFFEEVIEIGAPLLKYYLPGSNPACGGAQSGVPERVEESDRSRSMGVSSTSPLFLTPLQSPRPYASPGTSPRPLQAYLTVLTAPLSSSFSALAPAAASRDAVELKPGVSNGSGSEADFLTPRSSMSTSTPSLTTGSRDVKSGTSYTSESESDFFSPRSSASDIGDNRSQTMDPAASSAFPKLGSNYESESEFFSPRSTLSDANEGNEQRTTGPDAVDSASAQRTAPSIDSRGAESLQGVRARVDVGNMNKLPPNDQEQHQRQPDLSATVTTVPAPSSSKLADNFSPVSSSESRTPSAAPASQMPGFNGIRQTQQPFPGTSSISSATAVPRTTPRSSREEQELLSVLTNESLRENLRKEVEKRIASLQRRVRSLSDSAISSDYTDVESNSVSPRSGRLREGEKFFGEVGAAFSDRNVYVGHAAASLHASHPRGFGALGLGAPDALWKSPGLKQADSGNVYDGEDVGSDASSTIVASPEPLGDGSFDSRLSLSFDASRGSAPRLQDEGEVEKYLKAARLDSMTELPETSTEEGEDLTPGMHRSRDSSDDRMFHQGLSPSHQQNPSASGKTVMQAGLGRSDRGRQSVQDPFVLYPELAIAAQFDGQSGRTVSQTSDGGDADPFNIAEGWTGGQMAALFSGFFEHSERDPATESVQRGRQPKTTYRPLQAGDVWHTLPPSPELFEQQRSQLTISRQSPWSFEKYFFYQPRPRGRFPERLIDAILSIRHYPLFQSLSPGVLRRSASQKSGPRFRGRRTRSLDDLPGIVQEEALRNLIAATYKQQSPQVSQYPSSGRFGADGHGMTEGSLSGFRPGFPGDTGESGASATDWSGGALLPSDVGYIRREMFAGDLNSSQVGDEELSGRVLRQLPSQAPNDEDLLFQCYNHRFGTAQRPLSPADIRLARRAVEELLLNMPWSEFGVDSAAGTASAGAEGRFSTSTPNSAAAAFSGPRVWGAEAERSQSEEDASRSSPKEASMDHNSSSDSITFVFVGQSQRREERQPDNEVPSPVSAEYRTDEENYQVRSVSEYSTASSGPEDSTGYRGHCTFWPVSERSVSSDNIPKQLEKPMTLHRSRSASLLDVESAVDDFSGSIFPSHPVDTDRESVSSRRSSSVSNVYDASSDYQSSRTSPSADRLQADRWRGNLEKDADVARSSEGDEAVLDAAQISARMEEASNRLGPDGAQFKTWMPSEGDLPDGSSRSMGRNTAVQSGILNSAMGASASQPLGPGISLSIQTSDETLAEEREQYLREQLLQQPHSHRPTSSRSRHGLSRLSHRLSYSDSNLYIRARHNQQHSDQTAYMMGSSDSLLLLGASSSGPGTEFLDSTLEGPGSASHVTGLYKTHSLGFFSTDGRPASEVAGSEGDPPSWYALSAMMLETTHLLKSIQERIPGTSLSSSSPPASNSTASVVRKTRLCEMGIQTGRSLNDLHSAEMQTQAEVTKVDSETSMMDSASLEDFVSAPMQTSHTQTASSDTDSVLQGSQAESKTAMSNAASMTQLPPTQVVAADADTSFGFSQTSVTGAWASQVQSASLPRPVESAEVGVGTENEEPPSVCAATVETAVGTDDDAAKTQASSGGALTQAEQKSSTVVKPGDRLRSTRRKQLEQVDGFSQTETDADYIHILVAQDREHHLQTSQSSSRSHSPLASPRGTELQEPDSGRAVSPSQSRPLSRAWSADVQSYRERVAPGAPPRLTRNSSSQTDRVLHQSVGTDSMPADKAVSTDGLQDGVGAGASASGSGRISGRVVLHSVGVQKNDVRTIGLSTRDDDDDDRQLQDENVSSEDSVDGVARVFSLVECLASHKRNRANMSSQTDVWDGLDEGRSFDQRRESPSIASPGRGDLANGGSGSRADAEVQALAAASTDGNGHQHSLGDSHALDIPGYNSVYIMAEISKLKDEHAKMMQLLERNRGQHSHLVINGRDGKFRSSDSNASDDVSPVTVIEQTSLSPQGDADSPPILDQRLPAVSGRAAGQRDGTTTQGVDGLGARPREHSSGSVERGHSRQDQRGLDLQTSGVPRNPEQSGGMDSEEEGSRRFGSGVDRAILYMSSTSSVQSGSSRSSSMQGEDIAPSSLLGVTISDRVSAHLGLRADQEETSASSLFKPVPLHSSDRQSVSSTSSRQSTGSQADSAAGGRRSANCLGADSSGAANLTSGFRSLSTDRLGRLHPGSFLDSSELRVPGRSASADSVSRQRTSTKIASRDAVSDVEHKHHGRLADLLDGEVVGDILSDDASGTSRVSPVPDQLEDQDSWLSASSLDSSLRRFISTGVEVSVDSSDEFTQTDVPRGAGGRMVATTTEGIQVELERLQKERLEIIELLSLNYLPTSLTVELLEAKLNYCIGQTDMLLASLDENAALGEERHRADFSQELAAISQEYLTRYRRHFHQDKRDIAACMEARQRSQQGSGRGRRRTRNRDLLVLRRRAEIEAFKLERQREQQLHERARSASPFLVSTSPVQARPEFSPGYMTPRQHKNHLVGLRKSLVQASQEELRSRSLSPFLSERSVSPDYQPRSVYSSRESSFSLGFTPESSPSPEPRRASHATQARSQSLGLHSSSMDSALNSSSQARSYSVGNRPYRYYSPASRLYPRSTYPSRLASASWNLDPQALLEETAAIRHRNQLQISRAHHSISSVESRRHAISQRYQSSSYQSQYSSIRPHSPSNSAITDEDIDNEIESLKKEHEASGSSSSPLDSHMDSLTDRPGSAYASYAAYARDLLARSERSIDQTLQNRGVHHLTPVSQDSADLSSPSSVSLPPHGREGRYTHTRPVSSQDIRAHLQRRRSQLSPLHS